MNPPRPLIYAEDTDDDVFLMRRTLARAKITHPLIIAPDGRDVVRYLERFQGQTAKLKNEIPCLILLDVKMPFLGGLETLEWIRARPEFHCIPVVMFSSSSQTRDIERARQHGANAYLVKPSNLDELRHLIEDLRPICAHDEFVPGTRLALSNNLV